MDADARSIALIQVDDCVNAMISTTGETLLCPVWPQILHVPPAILATTPITHVPIFSMSGFPHDLFHPHLPGFLGLVASWPRGLVALGPQGFSVALVDSAWPNT